MKTRRIFENACRPLTSEEETALRESIEEVGILEPIVLWDEDVIDGHSRRKIWHKLGNDDDDLPQIQMDFSSDQEALEWIWQKQLGRRNLSPNDFKIYIGKLYNARKEDRGGDRKSKDQNDTLIGDEKSKGQNDPLIEEPHKTADEIAKEHGVSEAKVRRSGKLAEAHDDLCEAAKKLYAGTNKLTESHLHELAKKPKAEQQDICTLIRKGLKTADDLLGKKKSKPKPKTEASEDQPLWQQFAAKHAEALNHLTAAWTAISWIEKHGEDAAYIQPVITRIKTDYRQLRGTISGNCPVKTKRDGSIVTKAMERK